MPTIPDYIQESRATLVTALRKRNMRPATGIGPGVITVLVQEEEDLPFIPGKWEGITVDVRFVGEIKAL